jgi:hypothetical protein
MSEAIFYLAPADSDVVTLEHAPHFDPDDLNAAAQMLARQEVSDAIAAAMADYPGSSHDFHRETGIDPAVISRLVNGHNKQGATVATLAKVALALGKTLRISIE